MSKGSNRRPTNEQQYRDNFDKIFNPVAKHAHKFNKSTVHQDRTKYNRKKGQNDELSKSNAKS